MIKMDATELTKAMKRAALKAVDARKPVEICFGKVTSASPLKILVDQKMTLGKSQLVLARNVTEHKIKITGGNIQNYYYVGTPPNTSTVRLIQIINTLSEKLKSPYIMGWLSVMK